MRTTTLIPFVAFAMHLHGQAGLLDNTFSGDGKTTFNAGGDTKANAVLVQPDGKILVAGSGGDTPGNGRDFVVARYLTNGTLDPDFGVDGIATKGLTGTDEAMCLTLQPDGKIVLAGYYTLAANQYMAVVRLNADGTADADFGLGGQNFISFEEVAPFHSAGAGVAIQTDGRIVVCGSTVEDGASDLALARFDADGSLDMGFGNEGKVTVDVGTVWNEGHAVAIDNIGRIVVAGNFAFGSDASVVHRFLTDGQEDYSFQGGFVNFSMVLGPEDLRGILLLPNGNILVAGTGNGQFAASMLTSTGLWDENFGSDGVAQLVSPEIGAHGFALHQQPDAKYLIAGTFDHSAEPSDFCIARMNGNGSIDNSFGTDGWAYYDLDGFADEARGMALQADGKVVVCGIDNSATKKGAVIRVLNDVGIGLSEANAATHQLGLFPNPASESAQLRFVLPNGGPVTCTLIDHAGRAIRTLLANVSRPDGMNLLPIHLDGLPVGVYLLELRSADGVGRIPLVHR